jgi:hypothetical protein
MFLFCSFSFVKQFVSSSIAFIEIIIH